MANTLLQWFPNHWLLMVLISIGLNILIAITGILPSTFITVGTVGFFGFKIGLFILIVGEAAGAIVSFILYRKGVNKLSSYSKIQHFENKFLGKLKNTDGMTAIILVILLRILPFVPSGAVTLTSALSKMRLLTFSVASTLGKVPALFIEAYSINHVLHLAFKWQLGIILIIFVPFLLYQLWKRMENVKTDGE